MSLILSWVLFPLVLAAIGAGWGVVVERGAGARVNDALLLPLGLAAALVVAGTLTAFTATAPAAVPVVGVGTVAGLALAYAGRRRLGRWPLLAAVGALLVYGAPVLLSGQATFTGFIKLDDTSTWFNVIDHVMSHSRSVSGELPSTYSLVLSGDVGPVYPLGSFMLLGIGHGLTGIDVAWIFQPYMACCAAALALCVYALMEPVVSSARIRALLAFLAAQSALLLGYSLWGGIKELTAAFLLALGVALGAAILARPPARARELLPLAIAAGALIQTLGVGAAGWVAPALALVAVAWLWRGWRAEGRRVKRLRASAISIAWLSVLTAAFVVPVWLVLSNFLATDSALFSSGQSTATLLGNLIKPLSAFQLAGIWPVGDFRVTAPTLPSALLIGLVAHRGRRGAVPERAPPPVWPRALRGCRADRSWRGLLLRRHAMGHRQGACDLLAGAARRGADRRRDAVEPVEPQSCGRHRGGPRGGGARRRRALVHRPGLSRSDARAAPTAGGAAAHRRSRRGQGTDVHQRVRNLRRPALPAGGRSGRAGRVPHGGPAPAKRRDIDQERLVGPRLVPALHA